MTDHDLLLVGDVSKSEIRSTTLSNLYENFIKIKTPSATGALNTIQLKGKNGFVSSPELSYDSDNSTLQVEGKIATRTLHVEGTLSSTGAVFQNIKTITTSQYDVEDDDYTLLCNSRNNVIVVTLPPACNCRGRTLVIKKANSDKYYIKSHVVKIRVSEGRIDINDETVLKMNYSSRTLQSDGENWWVIGTKGT